MINDDFLIRRNLDPVWIAELNRLEQLEQRQLNEIRLWLTSKIETKIYGLTAYGNENYLNGLIDTYALKRYTTDDQPVLIMGDCTILIKDDYSLEDLANELDIKTINFDIDFKLPSFILNADVYRLFSYLENEVKIKHSNLSKSLENCTKEYRFNKLNQFDLNLLNPLIDFANTFDIETEDHLFNIFTFPN